VVGPVSIFYFSQAGGQVSFYFYGGKLVKILKAVKEAHQD
jgi:hypothetical protein